MNLITGGKELTMTSLQISEVVKSRHDKVKQSIERLVARGIIPQPPLGAGPKSANNTVIQVYLVNERSSYIVVAQLSPEFTAALVDEWTYLKNKNILPDFTDPIAAAKAFIKDQESIARLEKKEKENLAMIDKQKKAITKQLPAVAFVDTVKNSKGGVLMSTFAKILNQAGLDTGLHRVYTDLRKWGFCMNQAGAKNQPTQKARNMKLLVLKELPIEKDGKTFMKTTTYVTGKGQIYLFNLFMKNYGIDKTWQSEFGVRQKVLWDNATGYK